jgi:NAD(P)-dependent dehydrogenase (short-subunit alcohol dehydrogenase family)
LILGKFSLKGKVALISGGEGLYGRQVVAAVAEAGARTYIASPFMDRLQEVADGLNARGLDVTPLQLDLSDESTVLAVRDEIKKREGRLDILVNNAVLRCMKNRWWDTAEKFTESMVVNATGLFIITRAMGDLMAECGNGGSIINIGSIQGLIGPDPTLYEGTEMSGFNPDYFFHKGGMVNFTRFTASFYGANGVRCNCICPGGFWTDDMPESFVTAYSRRTFVGRLANMTDLMGAIVFLASDASEYVTGAILPVDGGYTAK